MKNLYKILQVHPQASNDVIKKAYYTLINKSHPDKGGDIDLTVDLNQAYEILINPQKRSQYDQQLKLFIINKMSKTEELKSEPPEEEAQPKEFSFLGEYQTPMMFGEDFIVANERGKRVFIINRNKDIVWEYGKNKAERLTKPRLAHFLADQSILIVDEGKQRVIKTTPQKETLWSYEYKDVPSKWQPNFRPIYAGFSSQNELLIVDKGNHIVFAVNQSREMTWEFSGKIKFNFKFGHLLIKQESFLPTCITELNNKNLLIVDQGNGRVLEIDRNNSLRWIYPGKKKHQIQGLNFAQRLENGNTLIASDKIIEVNPKGEVVWDYTQLNDSDVKQVYKLKNGSLLIDFVHLVKKGVNQEVMLVGANNKINWKHYYSQHRRI